ncbi:hypothetical protein [Thermococcus sp.]|uniref:hypothetical protein n=1 Tax=Thermococcus sp. TaxID=35749 RepID=UPI002610C4C9|nr:hypothetical protein [Thermococcus sp.]
MENSLRDALAVFGAVFLIAIFFLPAYYIGPLYFLLVAVYLTVLYLVEKLGFGKTAESVVDAVLFIVVMSLILKEKGEPLWQGLAIGGIILALELIKRHLHRDVAKEVG